MPGVSEKGLEGTIHVGINNIGLPIPWLSNYTSVHVTLKTQEQKVKQYYSLLPIRKKYPCPRRKKISIGVVLPPTPFTRVSSSSQVFTQEVWGWVRLQPGFISSCCLKKGDCLFVSINKLLSPLPKRWSGGVNTLTEAGAVPAQPTVTQRVTVCLRRLWTFDCVLTRMQVEYRGGAAFSKWNTIKYLCGIKVKREWHCVTLAKTSPLSNAVGHHSQRFITRQQKKNLWLLQPFKWGWMPSSRRKTIFTVSTESAVHCWWAVDDQVDRVLQVNGVYN